MFNGRWIAILLAVLSPAIAVGGMSGTASASLRLDPSAGSATQKVTINGPSVVMKVTKAGTTAKRTFKGSVGDDICVVITDPKMSDDGYDTIVLRGPDGVIDSNQSYGNGNPNGIGPVELTQNGTFSVEFKLDKKATGTGTLWVSAPVSVGTTSVNGSSESMDVTRVGQGVERTFTGTIGEEVTEVVTGTSNSDDGYDNISLLGPSGAVIDTNEVYGSGNPNGIGPDELTQNGTYTVLYQVDNTATGTAKLWVSAPVSIGTVSVNGSSESMDVTRVGQGVERTFKGTVGEEVTEAVTGTSNSDDGYDNISLLGPSGAVIDTNEVYGSGNPNGIGPDELTQNGTYTVLYQVDNTATGTATLWVSAPVAIGTVSVNGSLESMDVTRVGQGVERTFNGTSGEKITATVSDIVNSDDGYDYITLLGPTDSVIDTNEAYGNGNANSVGPEKLPSTGTYTVLYEVDNTATGTGKLTVST